MGLKCFRCAALADDMRRGYLNSCFYALICRFPSAATPGVRLSRVFCLLLCTPCHPAHRTHPDVLERSPILSRSCPDSHGGEGEGLRADVLRGRAPGAPCSRRPTQAALPHAGYFWKMALRFPPSLWDVDLRSPVGYRRLGIGGMLLPIPHCCP